MEVLDLFYIHGWIITVFVFILTIFLYTKWKQSLWRSQGVPGPDPVPFFGILRSYVKKGTCHTELELVQKYGPVVGTYFGNIPVLLVADPDMMKEILIKKFSVFTDRFLPMKRSERHKASVISGVGTHWKFLRTTLAPTFTTARLKEKVGQIEKCCKDFVTNIDSQRREGGSVEMKGLCEGFAMDVIASTAFGIDVNSQKEADNKFVHYGRLAAVGRLPAFYIMVLMMFPFLRDWIPITQTKTEVLKFFTDVTKEAVKLREQGNEEGKDFLQLMINARHTDSKVDDVLPGDLRSYKNRGLNELELTANSTLFFLAGYDTTANTLSFACYALATHPDVQRKLIDEIDHEVKGETPNYDSVSRLIYLDMFLNEVLRLYGAAIRIDRVCKKDTRIKNVFIPKGTIVCVPIFAIHRDPECWPDPEKFDPERFSEENKAKRPESSYLPFGLGPRICLGMRLALLELKIALVHILHNHRISPCEKTEASVTYEKGFILRAKNGIYVKMENRSDKIRASP